MSKIRSIFRHYEGMRKTKDGTWQIIGHFATLAEAKDAGATKCKPRFSR